MGLSTVTFSVGQIPIGALITRLAVGMDNSADPGEDFGLTLTYDDKVSGQPAGVFAGIASGLTRTGGGVLQEVEALLVTPVLVNPAGTSPDATNHIYFTWFNNAGSAAHAIYWAEVEYEIPNVEVGLNIP